MRGAGARRYDGAHGDVESRFLWGSTPLYESYKQAFQSKIMDGTARQFVTAKLAERDERHEKTGRSRYLVEPNLKEGKGACAI